MEAVECDHAAEAVRDDDRLVSILRRPVERLAEPLLDAAALRAREKLVPHDRSHEPSRRGVLVAQLCFVLRWAWRCLSGCKGALFSGVDLVEQLLFGGLSFLVDRSGLPEQ